MFFLFWVPGNFIEAQTFKGIPIKLKNTIEKSISSKNPMRVGEYFIGLPYISNRLSKSNPEKIYFSFKDFDCVTFVENVLALYYSEGVNNKFRDNLIKIRYNDSVFYESRNHYLTSGLAKLEKLNLLSPINNQFNSKFIQKKVSFLSKQTNDKHIDKAKIIAIENIISDNKIYYFDSTIYLQIDSLIKHGDVIAFLTSRNDLDFKHVGFVYVKNNKKYILHASQEKKIVCISELTIDKYLLKNLTIKGFQIYRTKK
jgi:hypothetical protein